MQISVQQNYHMYKVGISIVYSEYAYTMRIEYMIRIVDYMYSLSEMKYVLTTINALKPNLKWK